MPVLTTLVVYWILVVYYVLIEYLRSIGARLLTTSKKSPPLFLLVEVLYYIFTIYYNVIRMVNIGRTCHSRKQHSPFLNMQLHL